MPTTTNYGWTTPADTDLVKDGASAIRTLGSSIDSTLKTQIDAQIPDSLLTTKGDIIAATGASTPARLAVGTNDQVLIADSTTATGIKWGAAPAGGMTQLATGTLSGASVTISSISGSYRNLMLIVRNQYTTGGDVLWIRLNSGSGTNYFYSNIRSSSATTSVNADQTQWGLQTTASTTDTKSSATLFIYDYADANAYKNATWSTASFGAAMQATFGGGSWTGSTAAITSIQMLTSGGNWAGGTYTLYGVK